MLKKKRKEPGALGLFKELKDQEFIATILILCDVLQKGDESLSL